MQSLVQSTRNWVKNTIGGEKGPRVFYDVTCQKSKFDDDLFLTFKLSPAVRRKASTLGNPTQRGSTSQKQSGSSGQNARPNEKP